MNIIGLTGQKGSGKSTAAGFIRDDFETRGYDARVYALADKLKDISRDVFGLTREQVYGSDMKEVTDARWGTTPRKIMQHIGQSFREIHKDVWVRYLEGVISDSDIDFAIIEDVRYPNEANMVRRNDGFVIGLLRPKLDREYDGHSSETTLTKHWDDMTDTTVVNENEGQLDILESKVVKAVEDQLVEVL